MLGARTAEEIMSPHLYYCASSSTRQRSQAMLGARTVEEIMSPHLYYCASSLKECRSRIYAVRKDTTEVTLATSYITLCKW